MSRKGLGEFEHQVLLAILRLGRESYSVPIVAELEERTSREVATAAVYIALRRLEKKGVLVSRLETPEESGAPYPRRYFALTESAIEPLKEARRSFLSLWEGLEPQLDDLTDLRVSIDDYSLQHRANKDALKGALLNLISNACQACGENARIELTAARDDDALLLTVKDNGPGIPADVVQNIFDPFFTTRPQGTGLGLAVVQAVAAAHDGKVTVNSTKQGCEFSLRLPVEACRNEVQSND